MLDNIFCFEESHRYGLHPDGFWSYDGVYKEYHMELRLQISDDLVKKLQDKIGANVKITDIARDALTLFNWAVDERAKGRLILSSDEEGDKMTRLAMPSIENAAPQ